MGLRFADRRQEQSFPFIFAAAAAQLASALFGLPPRPILYTKYADDGLRFWKIGKAVGMTDHPT
ncbi:hypothetical protein BU16DRAFT_527685 [Lophium mytilinum]|uniref:Uncharacterized protein n=1 Tax=Lophium mytilinum TaxID=390894 RepID=A0A6A6QQJ4_9PEZI|nr:hypothetical protein BU16DRAFT_527685 [Lophium mytilinum]